MKMLPKKQKLEFFDIRDKERPHLTFGTDLYFKTMFCNEIIMASLNKPELMRYTSRLDELYAQIAKKGYKMN